MNINVISRISHLFRMYTNLNKRVSNLFENMLTTGLNAHCRTAGLPHAAARTAG
jgi:hypothetical protein